MSEKFEPPKIKNLGLPAPGEPGWGHFVAAYCHRIWSMEAQLAHHYALEAAKKVEADLQAEKDKKETS
ncbi:hypothetical protein [Maricaulis sp.]|uniref:hypothetical protein n=1 Tax=Maricaulis sp. TaxID=1486257 RepID=UPI00260FD37C|nr:hypothetical protein [Maricaulis sp.]